MGQESLVLSQSFWRQLEGGEGWGVSGEPKLQIERHNWALSLKTESSSRNVPCSRRGRSHQSWNQDGTDQRLGSS